MVPEAKPHGTLTSDWDLPLTDIRPGPNRGTDPRTAVSALSALGSDNSSKILDETGHFERGGGGNAEVAIITLSSWSVTGPSVWGLVVASPKRLAA